jgi:hypothetical protein
MTEKKTPSPAGSSAAGRDFNDMDYWQKLTPEERAWLDKFAHEYYSMQLHAKPLHKTKANKKKLYDNDNARRRDLWNNSDRSSVPVETLPEESDDE